MKTTSVAREVGYDGAKQIKGHKRHIIVDTLGLLLMVVVSAASVTERAGAILVLAKIKGLFPRLRLKESDGGDQGQDFIQSVKDIQWVWEIVKRDRQQHWLQSPTLALDSRAHLRKRWDAIDALSIDYESLPATSEAFIYVAMVRIMSRRLA